jgi:four helix bundle protein
MHGTYQDLKVWRRPMDHVLVVIAVPVRFPSKKSMAWTSQMRPAAVSIPGNIAEGKVAFFRQRVVTVAIPCEGSLFELQTQNYDRMRARMSEAWGRGKNHRLSFGRWASSSGW